MDQNDNMRVYELGRSVPDNAKKGFHNGSFSGTDINPMWRIKTLTEIFGPAGFGWTTQIIEHWTEQIGNEMCVHVVIELKVFDQTRGWSAPIVGVGGNKSLQYFPPKNGKPEQYKISDEAYKMAYTDALSVACKALGIGADVYYEKDATKYSDYYDQTPAPQTAPVQPQVQTGFPFPFNNR